MKNGKMAAMINRGMRRIIEERAVLGTIAKLAGAVRAPIWPSQKEKR
jgi:hypothetical protein